MSCESYGRSLKFYLYIYSVCSFVGSSSPLSVLQKNLNFVRLRPTKVMDRISCFHESILTHIITFLPSPLLSVLQKNLNFVRLRPTKVMDRISCLHESILSHIITFLPSTDEAIRTRILSKQWRNLMVPSQKLLFSRTDQKNTDLYLKGIASFIDRTLPLDTCPRIDRYEIRLKGLNWSLPYLDLAVQVAIKRHVPEIILELHVFKGFYSTLPPSLCLYPSLETLVLRNHCLDDWCLNLQWTSLKSLTLEFTYLTDDAITIILQTCPKLEHLELSQCYGFNRISDAGSSCLRKLVVIQYKESTSHQDMIIVLPKLECLILKLVNGLELMDISLVVDVYVDFLSLDTDPYLEKVDSYYPKNNLDSDWLFREDKDIMLKDRRDIFMEILKKVSHVKRLRLGSWCIKVISSFLWRGLPSTILLPKCKSLLLEAPLDGWDIPGILSLLRSSPYLETLVVNLTIETHYKAQSSTGNEIGECNAKIYGKQPNNFPKQFLEHLKIVRIAGLSPRVFDFAKLLLQNAKYLEKMELTNCNGKNDSSLIIHNILQLPRSSPAAQILVI